MPEPTSLHARLTSLAYSFALQVVGLAVDSTVEEIAASAEGSAPPDAHRGVQSTKLTLTIPRPHNGVVHASDYVEPLIAIVHDAPWATRSRELRAMLGVGKDPFLRIVELALATGRIVRTGYKATITYLPAKDGKPLKVAASRMAAGARPKSKKGYPNAPRAQAVADESVLASSAVAGTRRNAP